MAIPTGVRGAASAAAGEHTTARAEPCGARELYCGLYRDATRHAQFVAPAFSFAADALRAASSELTPCEPEQLANELVRWGAHTLPSPQLDGHAPSWPARVVREYAPAGLCDGAWLAGLARSSGVPHALQQVVLEQASLRLVGSAIEGYPQRYAQLLRSLGVVPEAVTRWEFSESLPCADISYEHALLGVSLGLFPGCFGPEALGFNLWMATLGPAPILERLRAPLSEQGAWLSYLDARERVPLANSAQRAVAEAARAPWTADVPARIARGFAAAHHSYLRWERAMWSGNVPFTPDDSVLDMVRRKARFAAEHHGAVRVRGQNLQELLEMGEAGHRLLVDVLGASHWVRPGDPRGSRLLSHSLSIGGPMFDAFTASEKADLTAWVVALGQRPGEAGARSPVALSGHYTALHDPAQLQASARALASDQGQALRERLAAADAETDPITICALRLAAERLAAELASLVERHAQLEPYAIPAYSDSALCSMAASARPDDGAHAWESAQAGACGDEGAFWLAGFADVRRVEYEDYAYLARSYFALRTRARASAWPALPQPLAPFARAAARASCEFVPELLGLHLGWLTQCCEDEPCRALAVRAAHAFMSRTRQASRTGAATAWRRLFRLWRCHSLLVRNTTEPQSALLPPPACGLP